MGWHIYANQEVNEGSTDTEVTITLSRKSRAIEIINDSASDDLEYKFHDSETYATLKSQEAVSADIITRQVILNSPSTNSVDYRVRVLG